MRLTARQKLKILKKVLQEGERVSSVCSEAGIARKTFYQWKKTYLQTPNRIKNQALKLNYASGKHHPKNKRYKFEDRVISIVVSYPSWGSRKISAILCKYTQKISNHAVYSLLKDLNLETKEKREEFSSLYQTFAKIEKIYQSRPLRLTPETRKRIIEEVVIGKEPVVDVCQRYHVSRKTFYKWLARYQEAKEKEAVLLQAMEDDYVEGFTHPRSISEKVQEEILRLVRQNPEYSTHKIAQILAEVGNHGVQNVFQRLSLNTYEKRLAYAEAYQPTFLPVAGVLDRVKPILGKIPVISAIPPPKAKAFRRAGPPFIFSFLFSVIFSTIFIYWLRMLSQAPTFGVKLGLFFASVSLIVGGFFFAYSIKYYLTLAIVLSFSRQAGEEGVGVGLTGEVKRSGNGGWLARIFGLGNGNEKVQAVPTGRQAGGLQPSLEHLKLKRYPFVSIHLPFYNERKVAERILKACTAMDYPNFEIVVIDDSTDETTKIVERFAKKHNKANPHGPKIKVLHRPSREGFKGGALAYALQHIDAKTEFVVVFDADFIPYPDTLELFIKYFKANNQGREDYTKSKIAVVGGYQWHVLNKSENWITRGVRTEYAGSYVIERPGREILGLIKQISGSVYMIRADLLKKIGWGTSITEDFQLTLKLYEQGYKVIYTPYVQAPAECVSTLKRLIRQRMRWSEGHSNCIKRMFPRLISSPKLTFREKLEVLYLSPYYLQAAFFLVGTFCWLLAETVFRARLPFWTSLWGWSLVLTNMLSLPLVNAVGLFLEESEERDYLGLLSFLALSYIMVPFQAYASVKGFIEKEEGPWFRTPKTGKITDIFTRGRFYRWVAGILPGRQPAPAVASASISSLISANPYVALATANNRFENFRIPKKQARWIGRTFLVALLISSTTLLSLAPAAPYFIRPKQTQAKGFGMVVGPGSASSGQANQQPVPTEVEELFLEILNIYSHPKEGGHWVVNFKTTGRTDLTITPNDQATIDGLDFVSLKCLSSEASAKEDGDEEREPKIFDGPAPTDKDIIFYPNWGCAGTGNVTHRVNKAGKHTLKFQFGDQVAYAYNSTQVDTSTSDSTTAYSFQRKTWYDGTRLWSAFHSGSEIEFWYSENWGSSWTQNTLATLSIDTNDFSIEADSSDLFIAYTDDYDTKVRAVSGYDYRKQIPITGQSGAGTNYQVKLEVHSGSGTDSNGVVYLSDHSQDFPNDIRFTDDNGTTELDHWLEELDIENNKAAFWIEIKDDLSSNQNFYIYYGNSSANSASNGTNTFTFFDDFEASSLDSNKWDLKQGAVDLLTDLQVSGIIEQSIKPAAQYYSGTYNRTYFVYYTARKKVQIRYYDHDADVISSPTTIHTHTEAYDLHDAPSILVLSSGKILVFYGHHSSALYVKKSTNAEDISSWGSAITVESSASTYRQPIQLSNGDIWVFYRRDVSGTHGTWCYRVSTTDGDSWGSINTLVDFGDGYRIYGHVVRGGTSIHVAWWRRDNSNYENAYYIYSPDNGSTWKTRGGTTRTPPIDATEADLVYDTPGGGQTLVYDIKLDGSNNPYIAIIDDLGNNPADGRFAFYDSGWETHFVCDIEMVVPTDKVVGGMTIDEDDVYTVYASVPDAGIGEIQKWTSGDDGDTWAYSSSITDNSKYDQWYPQTVKDGTSSFKLLWDVMRKWTSYLDYDSYILSDISGLEQKLELVGTAATVAILEGKTVFSAPKAYVVKAASSQQIMWAQVFCGSRKQSDNNERAGQWYGQNTANDLKFATVEGGTVESSGLVSPDDDDICTWHQYEVIWGGVDDAKAYIDGTLKATHTNYVPSADQVFWLQEGATAGSRVLLDWVFVRKYNDPEPSVGTAGSEGSAPVYPGTSFFWGTASVALDGTASTSYAYPIISRDSSGYLWGAARYASGSSPETFYFDDYSTGEAWPTTPDYMVDNILTNYAEAIADDQIQLNNSNTYTGGRSGTISTVEIRAYGYTSGDGQTGLRAVYGGSADGDTNWWSPTTSPAWSGYYDITTHANAPSPWTWGDIQNLDVDVEMNRVGGPDTNYVAKVEVRVTYTPNYYMRARKSSAANDPSSWEATTYDLSSTSNTDANVYGVISSLGSQNMYCVWIRGTTIEGKKWTQGSGWDVSATSIDTGVTGLSKDMSAVVDTTNYDIHLLYIDDETTDQVSYKRWDSGTASWDSSPVNLDASDTNAYVTLSLDSSTGDLYALWIDTSNSYIYYRTCDVSGASSECSASGDWASELSWQTTGTNAWVTSNYSGNGMIFAQWTGGTGSPYSVMWDYVIIPEKIWLFLALGLIIPGLLRRKKRKMNK